MSGSLAATGVVDRRVASAGAVKALDLSEVVEPSVVIGMSNTETSLSSRLGEKRGSSLSVSPASVVCPSSRSSPSPSMVNVGLGGCER